MDLFEQYSEEFEWFNNKPFDYVIVDKCDHSKTILDNVNSNLVCTECGKCDPIVYIELSYEEKCGVTDFDYPRKKVLFNHKIKRMKSHLIDNKIDDLVAQDAIITEFTRMIKFFNKCNKPRNLMRYGYIIMKLNVLLDLKIEYEFKIRNVKVLHRYENLWKQYMEYRNIKAAHYNINQNESINKPDTNSKNN